MSGLRRAAAPLAGMVIALALLVQGRGLDEVAREGQFGPGFWPRLVLVGVAAACLVRLLFAWRGDEAPAPAVPDPGADSAPIDWGRLGLGTVLIVAYVLAIPWLGFPVTTVAFMVAFMRLAAARSAVGTGATAVLGTVALLYVFVRVVYLPLPKGAGPMEDVTIALYRALHVF